MRKNCFYNWRLILILLVAGSFYTKVSAQVQHPERLIEISGVILSSDSTNAVSNAIISVLHQNRGVMSNASGIFSLVCRPGDTLVFASVGYQKSSFTIPVNYTGKYYNHVQLMDQDTFYLPETVIYALPTGKAFVYAFKYWPFNYTLTDRALQRFNDNEVNYLRATLPMNGAENQSYYQQQQAIDAQYYGQVRNGIGILSPLKWQQFFKAWKRGDFRKKY